MSVTKAKAQKGESVMIWIDGKVVALSTNCAINYNTNMVDESSKDDGSYDNQTPGTLSWSITNDFIVTGEDRTSDLNLKALIEKWMGKAAVDVMWGVPKDWDGHTLVDNGEAWGEDNGWHGKAYITAISETHQKGQNSTANISLQGIGVFENM